MCNTRLPTVSGSAGARCAPVPRQKFVETVLGVSLDHAFKDVGEIGERFDAVEFCGFDQRANNRPAVAAAIGAGEEMILAPQRYGT